MHPALFVLVATTIVGAWLLRGRRLALAWALLAVAAALMLAQPLTLARDGIPGPIRLLGHLPPWTETVPAAGNPHARDVIFQVDPWLVFLRDELRSGRLPFWNPFQSAGTPLWANGQSAVLFPLHLLVALLPLEVGLVLLAWARVVIAGLGIVVLARALGIGSIGSLAAALSWCLGGRMAAFLLYPMANAMALLPWTLWAAEGIAQRRRHALVHLATAAGLQLLGGHPETAAYSAVAGGLWVLARSDGWRRLPALAGGWALGAMLAAVQIVPLLVYLPTTARWQAETGGGALGFAQLLPVWSRILLPNALGSPAEGTWFGPFNEVATAGFLGVLVVPLVLVVAFGRGRSPNDIRLLVLTVVCGAVAYSLPGIHELHRHLPIIGKGLAHSALPVFQLGLVLLAGLGLDRWLNGTQRTPVRLATGTCALLLASVVFALGESWAARGIEPHLHLLLFAAVLTALVAAPARELLRRHLAVVLVTVAAADLLYSHAPTLGVGRSAELLATTEEIAATRALIGTTHRLAAVGEVLRPNLATVLRLRDIRGDDTLELVAFDRLWNTFAGEHATFYTPITNWSHQALDALSVRAVLVPRDAPPPDPSWREIAAGHSTRVFERPSALPMVRLEPPDAGRLEVIEATPGRWKLHYETQRPTRLVVAEIRAAGWRATGGTLVDHPLGLLALDLPQSAGELTLEYRPPGLTLGAFASLLGLLVLVGIWGVDRWRLAGPASRSQLVS